MLKDRIRVNDAANQLGVSKTIVYRRLKKFKHLLKGKVVKEKGITYITPEGLEVLKTDDEQPCQNTNNGNGFNTVSTGVETEFKVLTEVLKQQVKQLENQLNRKDKELDKRDETINKLIDRQAESEEKLQTIIMKLTQDLEQVRQENRLLLEDKKQEETPSQKEPERAEEKKSNTLVSIEEYIEKKVQEDKERSQYEEEKQRLQRYYERPVEGRSVLYRMFVRLFQPEKLRETV